MGDPGAAPPKKKGGCLKIFLIITIILVVLGIIGSVVTFFVCRSAFMGLAEAEAVTVGVPVAGTMGPSGMTVNGEPRIDHPLEITTAGSYQIDLVSSDTGTFDPVLILVSGSEELARNDDGPNGLNSQIVHELQPGSYIVRVSAFAGRPASVVPYTLTVAQPGAAAGGAAVVPPAGGGAAAPPAGGGAVAPPAGGGGGCATLAACCAVQATAGPAVQASLSGVCAALPTYQSMPNGDQTCSATLTSLQAVPGLPPQCTP